MGAKETTAKIKLKRNWYEEGWEQGYEASKNLMIFFALQKLSGTTLCGLKMQLPDSGLMN